MSLGDIQNCQEISDWEECPERPLSPGEGTSRRGLWEREARSKQELSQREGRRREVPEGHGQRRPLEQPSWEDDRDRELSPHSWESRNVPNPRLKARLREDDGWHEISVLSLREESGSVPGPALRQPEPPRDTPLLAPQGPQPHDSCPLPGTLTAAPPCGNFCPGLADFSGNDCF
ncbi:unnamed protein product [Coccothraustes coccothraustes]